jgi:hypothetical protein
MLSEGRKRDTAANAVLGIAFAANAAQSPKDFIRSGHIESPGVVQMQRTIGDPRKKPKDLNKEAVLRRGTRLKEEDINNTKSCRKMKTFKEFVEEAYLHEMRKEDKVKGKKKHPLNITQTSGRVERAPEGSDKKWKVKKTTRTTMHPDAEIGRYLQGMRRDPHIRPGGEMGGASGTYNRHAHGGGGYGAKAPGRKRGVGKIEQQKIDREQRERGERPLGTGISPAEKVRRKQAMRNRSQYSGKRI